MKDYVKEAVQMADLQVIEDLREVRRMLSHPNHWTKGAWARDLNGQGVYLMSDKAVCYCLAGAMQLVSKDAIAFENMCGVLHRYIPGSMSFTTLNDQSTHEEVMALLDRALSWRGDV